MKNFGRMILAMAPVLLFSAPPAAAFERERPASQALRIVEARSAGPGFAVQEVSQRRGGPRQGGHRLGRHPGSTRHQFRRDHGGARHQFRRHHGARPHQFRQHHGVRPHHFRHAPRVDRHRAIHPRFRHPGIRHHRPRVHTGFHFSFGVPVRPWPPVVVAPPVVVQPAPPPVYVERPAQYWYYCREAQAYYPYVTECPGQWVPVVPHAW